MNPGRLNKRIAFFRDENTGQKTELGAEEIQEQQYYECWAAIEPRTGSLLTGRAADTVLSKTTHKITVRYDERISYGSWIIYDGRRFDIDYILDPDFKKRYLEIFVQEVVG